VKPGRLRWDLTGHRADGESLGSDRRDSRGHRAGFFPGRCFMGIDIHIGDHYFAVGHLPLPVLVVLSAVVLYVVWKVGRYAIGAWLH
jgi:hypothetical protein